MESQTKSISVEQASKYLAKILRHEGENHPDVDQRGWCNLKDVRLRLNAKYPGEEATKIIDEILEADIQNRFQLESGDTVAFIRATRGHTRSNVDLINPCPHDKQLTWYLYESEDAARKVWVEATSKEVASKLLSRRSSSIPHIPTGQATTDEFEETDKTRVTEGTLRNGLRSREEPIQKVHQSASKYLSEDVRSNMGGYKEVYVRPHPNRTRSRLPETDSESN